MVATLALEKAYLQVLDRIMLFLNYQVLQLERSSLFILIQRLILEGTFILQFQKHGGILNMMTLVFFLFILQLLELGQVEWRLELLEVYAPIV